MIVYKKELIKMRKSIDAVDADILKLFRKRMKLVDKVSTYKIAEMMDIYDGNRETEILLKAEAAVPGYKNGAKMLMEALIEISKSRQREIQKNGKLDVS